MMSISIRQKGYTLLEMAIVLAVAGTLLVTAMLAYKVYLTRKTLTQTETSTSMVIDALGNYLIQHGRYPCPARYDVVRGSANYGIEGNCNDTSVAVGTCASGICVEESERSDVDIDPDPLVTTLITPRVRRGAVPFRTLGLPEEFAQDGYGMRLHYVLTEILADASTYQKANGGISIIDNQSTPESIITPPATAHYLVFSSGPDKAGAYTANGGRMSIPCPAGTADAENCNTSGANNKAIYRFTRNSDVAGADKFDDYVLFYASVETPLWRIADDEGLDIRDLLSGGTAVARIGIGTNDPSQTLQVASGNMYVRTNSQANRLCDVAGNDCFKTTSIGGDEPAMQCPLGEYVQRIENDKVECTDNLDIRCPTGTIMTGIDGNGIFICKAVVGCPETLVTTCAPATAMLPAGVEGQIYDTPMTGYSFRRHYRCTNGTWVPRSPASTGLCSCVNQVNTPGAVQCNVYKRAMCGNCANFGHWSGTVPTTTNRTCPANAVTTYGADNCQCVPRNFVEAIACPTGYTGSGTKTTPWVCDTATTGHYEAPVINTASCTCTATVQNDNPGCPVGYTGVRTRTRTFDCGTAPPSWGPWTDVINTCSCTGATEYRTVGCPTGQVGTIYEQRNYNCATDTFDAWTETSRSCANVVHTWQPVSGTTNVGKVGVERGSYCTQPVGNQACYFSTGTTPPYRYYDECSCL